MKASTHKIQILNIKSEPRQEPDPASNKIDLPAPSLNGTRIYEPPNETKPGQEYLSHMNGFAQTHSSKNEMGQSVVLENGVHSYSEDYSDYGYDQEEELLDQEEDQSYEEGEIVEADPLQGPNPVLFNYSTIQIASDPKALHSQQILQGGEDPLEVDQNRTLWKNSQDVNQIKINLFHNQSNSAIPPFQQNGFHLPSSDHHQEKQSSSAKNKRFYSEAFTQNGNELEGRNNNAFGSNTIRLVINPANRESEEKEEVPSALLNNNLEVVQDMEFSHIAQPQFEPPMTEEEKKEEQRAQYQKLMDDSIRDATNYNLALQQGREERRKIFEKQKRTQERNPLHQNHNSFLHTTYQPGQNFVSYMNNIHHHNYLFGHKGQQPSAKQRTFLPNPPQQNGYFKSQTNAKQQQTFNYFMGNKSPQHINNGDSKGRNGQFKEFITFSSSKNRYLGNADRFDSNGDLKQSPMKGEGLAQSSSEYQHEPLPSFFNSQSDFICITCKRGPPHTKKYAKNQCQTCYKKTKKYTEDSMSMHQQMGQFNSSSFIGGSLLNGAFYNGQGFPQVMFQNNMNDFHFRSPSFFNKSSSSEALPKAPLLSKSLRTEEELRDKK